MNKKVMLLIASAVAATVIFVLLIGIQSKILTPHGLSKVYYSIKEIDENTQITEDNFNNYFKSKSVSNDLLVDGVIKEEDKDKLLDVYLTQKIPNNQQVSEKETVKVEDKLEEIINRVEVSIKFSDISDVVGGILKPGDKIHLVNTEGSSNSDNVITVTELKNVLVSKIFAADGSEIDRSINNQATAAATTINLYMSVEDAHKLDNALATGKIRAIKPDSDNQEFNDIRIEKGK